VLPVVQAAAVRASFIIALPFRVRSFYDECVATMDPLLLSFLDPIDNTVHNRGIMRSHNLTRDFVMKYGRDWLVVLSAAVRFGERGGLDFIDALGEHAEHDVVEAAGVYGWHLIAFHRRILDDVGSWDENFSPYGFDDIDMSIRIQNARNIDGRHTQLWTKVPVDVTDTMMGHSIHLGGVRTNPDAQIDYFRRKWGRHPGDGHIPAYTHPFNDPVNPQSYWPPCEKGVGEL
jgi:hypothetical protein